MLIVLTLKPRTLLQRYAVFTLTRRYLRYRSAHYGLFLLYNVVWLRGLVASILQTPHSEKRLFF